jgi:hypothetical protein
MVYNTQNYSLFLVLMHLVCNISFCLLLSPSSTNVRALYEFLLLIFPLSPAEFAWSQVIK